MKIAFDAKRALNNSTGLGNHARILLNALMRDFPENEYLLFSPKVVDEFFHGLNDNFKLFLPETKFQKIFHPGWRSFGISHEMKAVRADVYHGLSNELPFNIHRLGVKTVVTIHDLIFLKHTEQYPFTDRQIYKLKTKHAAIHSDRIVAVSKETKDDLINFYKIPEEKIEVIHPSVDMAFQMQGIADNTEHVKEKYSLPEKFVLNVGSFFPRKNQETIVEAFEMIKDKIEEGLVLIGGSGNTLKKIEELVHIRKLGNRVKIITGVSNEDLPAIYRNASLFVFPSLYEGFGAPVLEALFSKVPVVATKGGAIEEAGGKNSVYINPRSAEEIAEAMLKVVINEKLRLQMTQHGFVHAQGMSDKVFADKTMNVYRKILNA